MDTAEILANYKSIEKYIFGWASSVFTEFNEFQKTKTVYYYTDMNALVNGIIVPNPEANKEICLWATKWSHLNDKEENQAALNVLQEALNDDVFNSFVILSDDNHSVSFSKEQDSLPMWSMYGSHGGGVMLEFDVQKLLKIYGARLMPCVYLNTDYYNSVCANLFEFHFDDTFEHLSQHQKVLAVSILTQMFIGVTKNPAFHYENEVRIVGIGNKYFYDTVRQEEFRVKNGVLIPYIKEFLPKTCLKAVWLGPSMDKVLSQKTLRAFLDSHQIGAEVKCSSIPYRG